MSGRGRPVVGLAAAVLAALSIGACGESESEPCTRADLDQPVPVRMPAPVAITHTRQLNGDRLVPLAAGARPLVAATAAWQALRVVRGRTGGGTDELLLGSFDGRGYARVPAWVLFTTHVAERLDPAAPLPGVKRRPGASVCAFVDVLTVLNATTGQRFDGSTVTSAGAAPVRGHEPAAAPGVGTAPVTTPRGT